jgi:hypothetical protein
VSLLGLRKTVRLVGRARQGTPAVRGDSASS